MHQIAIAALLVSVILSCLAIRFLLPSPGASKLLLSGSTVFALLGSLAAAARMGSSVLNFWATFLSATSLGCALGAAMRLFARSTRWVHRVVIYTGYAATFAAMGAIALSLGSRTISGWRAAVVLALAYVAGSAAVFLAKTLVARLAARTMPEYQASLSGPHDQSYW